jgi:hypothetical protein
MVMGSIFKPSLNGDVEYYWYIWFMSLMANEVDKIDDF